MRISVTGVRGIPHTYGGGDEFIRHVGPLLAARGHEVIVYCRAGLFADRSPYFERVRRVFLPTIEHKWAGQMIHATLAMLDNALRRPDVTYIHTLPSAIHGLIPWALRQPLVVNVDGIDWERDKWGRVGKAYLKLAARVAVRTADAIVSDAKEIQRIYREEFGRDSTFIAYGAEIVTSKNPAVLSEYGLEPGGYYLVACRLVPENNIDLIVRAFERVRTSRQLVIAGGANYESDWFRSLRSTQDARVRFLGHVADWEHVRELHCNCYAYVHGHSLGGTNPALLKALGAGNCVVAYNSPYNAEVLAGHGVLFEKDVGDARDKLQYVEDHPDVAAELRRRAPERIREAYTWEHIADEYERLFQKVAAREAAL